MNEQLQANYWCLGKRHCCAQATTQNTLETVYKCPCNHLQQLRIGRGEFCMGKYVF